MERLQKVIANAGYCSRRKAEELIAAGVVMVNKVVVTELGTKVDPSVDVIEIGGQKLKLDTNLVYYVLNKPRNCISTLKDDRERPTIIDCIEGIKERVYPVGRLDFDTTGVLLLTNDGDLTNKLTHPKFMAIKVYVATVKGSVDQERLEKLTRGVLLDDGPAKAYKVEYMKHNEAQGHSIVKIYLNEGRNREVKRMLEAIGYEVVKLNRESFAGISSVGLRQGQYRKLSVEEIEMLKAL